MKKTIFLLLIICNTIQLLSQNISIEKSEETLHQLFQKLIVAKTDKERLKANESILVNFKNVLQSNKSFFYPFNKLRHISILNSKDNRLRIYNWNIPLEDGTYKYFGFIQIENKNGQKLFSLTDQSSKIKKPEDMILSNNRWYGALYYKILTTSFQDKVYYTLLGWDGNDIFTNKKIIDVLLIKKNTLQFGAPVFVMENKTRKRIIFEYSKQTRMMLTYDKALKMITFDHLAPSLKKFKGQYMYYGPDLSQDGLEFIDGMWVLKPNLNLKNKGKKGKPIKTSY